MEAFPHFHLLIFAGPVPPSLLPLCLPPSEKRKKRKSCRNLSSFPLPPSLSSTRASFPPFFSSFRCTGGWWDPPPPQRDASTSCMAAVAARRPPGHDASPEPPPPPLPIARNRGGRGATYVQTWAGGGKSGNFSSAPRISTVVRTR